MYVHSVVKLKMCLLKVSLSLALCHLVLIVRIIDDSHSVFIRTERVS